MKNYVDKRHNEMVRLARAYLAIRLICLIALFFAIIVLAGIGLDIHRGFQATLNTPIDTVNTQ